ncbi:MULTISPECIES: DNA-3-methyladenine glycosylase I [unclassified Granulicatella]|uniref:DNA-3-methyladenine glycosylase I n=1 Tax=unclassified Granulicatella TaxID=2630493 RepID=UPI00107472FD|nr:MULTISPECIES: DNA-3-methyladenine glycosylase I [unclassified Granulicatella]MBF0780280.1 DNA-3-methyladenine glycosylase I [Granulicatella sp. 19428wC4_WM01]TFU95616.1 DNA-3-methyladenine glycosylase I [Granulicatella sp. WM01]
MCRCSWAENNALMRAYHDTEWGKPVYDDRHLFELLILEGKQAGLSWQIILNRRQGLREALDNFNWKIIQYYTDDTLEKLRHDERLIKHKLKIKALRENAIAFEQVCIEYGTFCQYIWSFVDNQPIVNHWEHIGEVPVNSELSDKISRDLKKRGFKFVGSTIIYSYLQAIGIINDHLDHCAFK